MAMATLERRGTVFPASNTSKSAPSLSSRTENEETSLRQFSLIANDTVDGKTRTAVPISALQHPSVVHLRKELPTSPRAQNPFRIPTAAALTHSLCLVEKPVWEMFEGIEYSSNQGTDDIATILCRRRYPRSDKCESLYVIKKERHDMKKKIKNVTKPMHENLVNLYSIFCHEDTVSFVYEEMDISLEQIFLLDLDPWSVNPMKKQAQIAAICVQILRGLEYFHHSLRLAHGAISMPNILMNRTGLVKLANVGSSIMRPRVTLNKDFEALADVFLSLCFPLDIKPDQHRLDEQACSFHTDLLNEDVRTSLKHDFLIVADSGQLVKLAVRTLRVSYNPPSPYEESNTIYDRRIARVEPEQRV